MKLLQATKIINKAVLICCLFVCQHSSFANSDLKERDCYISGYLKSIFENNYGISSEVFYVRDGVVILDKKKLRTNNSETIMSKTREAVKNLEFVTKVVWLENIKHPPQATICYNINTQNNDELYQDSAIPNSTLFKPLMADPQWPRFSLAYQYFLQDRYTKKAFAPNFGASFSLYRVTDPKFHSAWEVGIMAGLFGLMDVGRKNSALINADYYVALPITYKRSNFSILSRIYHLSSHLGDEFMLTPDGSKVKRINLSYEGVDVIGSYEFNIFRIYGGGGYMVRKDPKYIKPFMVQGGMEYSSNNTYFNGNFRPVAGIDIKAKQLSGWYPGISFKIGVQLENSIFIDRKMQLLLEYYKGKSIHGQFYNSKVQYIGIGLHAFL